jgi:ABC-2 type transport system permease protein
MNSFILFFKKEFTELIKTVKGIVLAVIFVFISIMSALIAKLMPEIFKLAGIDAASEELGALAAIIPPPTSVSSYEQFFGNFNQIGLLALIIVFAGIVANEKSRNTAAYILTKNISRTQFILSKFASAIVFTFISLVLSMGTQMIYTNILFEDSLLDTKNIILFFALLFLYLIFILSIVIFSSVLTKTVTAGTFFAFMIFIAFNLATIIPKIGKYMPPEINNFGILMQSKNLSDLTVNIILTVVCSAGFIIASLELFKRQEL